MWARSSYTKRRLERGCAHHVSSGLPSHWGRGLKTPAWAFASAGVTVLHVLVRVRMRARARLRPCACVQGEHGHTCSRAHAHARLFPRTWVDVGVETGLVVRYERRQGVGRLAGPRLWRAALDELEELLAVHQRVVLGGEFRV